MSKVSYLKSSTGRKPKFAWPPPLVGERIPVCASLRARYFIGVGLSVWNSADRPWVYFRPERWARGAPFPMAVLPVERLALFRGITLEARKRAINIFDVMAGELRKLAARDRRREA